MASMGLRGLKPASFSALRAATAPTTPRVPSYIPAKGMASVWDPDSTAPAHASCSLGGGGACMMLLAGMPEWWLERGRGGKRGRGGQGVVCYC